VEETQVCMWVGDEIFCPTLQPATTRIDTYIHMRTRTHTRTHVYTHTHAHTCIHAHTRAQESSELPKVFDWRTQYDGTWNTPLLMQV